MGALKEDLHKLIDSTSDEKLLEEIFMILSSRNHYQEGYLWQNLSETKKKEVLDSESETGNDADWIAHEDMKARNKKWLQ